MSEKTEGRKAFYIIQISKFKIYQVGNHRSVVSLLQLYKRRSYKSTLWQLSPRRRQAEKFDDKSYADALNDEVARFMTKISTA